MSEDSYGAEFQKYLERLSSKNTANIENDMDSFIENRKSFLHPLEVQELGDVTGKTLLHLQCRSGLETLSWARRGARVVGVDFDQQAVLRAHKLAQRTHPDADFHRVNIYQMHNLLPQKFDIVYTAYGVLFWLHNLEDWSKIIAHYLAPGGTFYLVDYHPTANLLDEIFQEDNPIMPQPRYPYGHTRYQHHSSTDAAFPPMEYRGASIWNYSLSDIINALIGAGLRIIYIHEHEYMFARRFKQTEQYQQEYWRWSNPTYHVPLLFSLKATH